MFSLLLALVQGAIVSFWNLMDEPMAIHIYPGMRHVLVCNLTPVHLFLAQFYNIFLSILTTVFSYLTRNVTENFNESKWTYFAMYTVGFAWLIDAVVWGLRVNVKDTENHDALNPEVSDKALIAYFDGI